MSGRLFRIGESKSEPIKSEMAPLVQQLVIKELLNVYPDLEFCCIGSVGKKKDGEFNGDIDIAIKTDSVEELETMIKKVFYYLDTVTSRSYYIVSVKWPYCDILDNMAPKFVTVDFMVMRDKEYTEFRYYCPDYRKDESKYKVGVKIMWANTILNHCKERLDGVNIENDEMGMLRFVPDGLWQTVFSTKDFHVISKNFITTDVDKIVNMVFDDGKRDWFNSVETLWEGIHSNHFRYPEEVKILERNLMVNSYRKSWNEKIDPHDFDFKYWDVDDIIKECKKYEFEKRINTYIENHPNNI